MNYQKVCIIIPAYNEESSIKSVIRLIKKVSKNLTIVVVNDGSLDNTSYEAQSERVIVLNLPFNLGIGGAVQTGLKYAKSHGFLYAVQVDADGQHNPEDIPKLLQKAKFDMVIGSRYLKKTKYKTAFLRLIGVKIFSRLINITCGKKIYDSTSGFRLFTKRAVDFFSVYYPQEFPEPRSIVALIKNGYRIAEVPVEMRERKSGQSSVNFLYAIYLMFSISIAILIESAAHKRYFYE